MRLWRLNRGISQRTYMNQVLLTKTVSAMCFKTSNQNIPNIKYTCDKHRFSQGPQWKRTDWGPVWVEKSALMYYTEIKTETHKEGIINKTDGHHYITLYSDTIQYAAINLIWPQKVSWRSSTWVVKYSAVSWMWCNVWSNCDAIMTQMIRHTCREEFRI